MSKCLQYDSDNKKCRFQKSKCGYFDRGKCNSKGEYTESKKHNYLKSEEKFHFYT